MVNTGIFPFYAGGVGQVMYANKRYIQLIFVDC